MNAVLSADGKRLAIADNQGLKIRALDSGREKQLLPFDKYGRPVSWSPDAKFIYYLHPGEKPWIHDLWRVAVNAGTTGLLIQHVSGRPALTPDGRSVAFTREDAIMLSGVDGKNEKVVCSPCKAGWDLTWSPDGSQLLIPQWTMLANKQVKSRLVLMDVKTGRTTELASLDGLVGISGVSWTSAGVLLAYSGRNDDASQIWHMSVPSGDRTQVTRDPTGYDQLIGATPDGLSVVAVRQIPPLGYWQRAIALFFGKEPGVDGPHGTVMLHLRK